MARPLGLHDYQAEVREVAGSVADTCRDLVNELRAAGQPVSAAQVDEAQAYLQAAFRGLGLAIVYAQNAADNRRRS